MKNLSKADLNSVSGGKCVVRCQYLVSDPKDLDNYEDFEFPEISSGSKCVAKAKELKKSGGIGCLFCAALRW